MATICNKKPPKVCFAENPVLIQVYSQLKEKKFLKVHLSVKMVLIQEGVQKRTSSTELSVPTTGNSEPVMFNISSLLKAALCQRNVQPLHGVASRYAGGYVSYSFSHWDSYLDADNQVIVSGKTTQHGLFAVPGGYSDIQRLIFREDTELTLGKWKILSNRPDWLIHPVNFPFVLPVLRFSESLSLDPLEVPVMAVSSKGVSSKVASVRGQPNEVENTLLSKEWFALSPGNYTVADKLRVTLVPENPLAVYFEFINRLGALESVVCYAKPKEKYKLQFDRNVRHQGYSFRPSSRFSKHISSEEYIISMTTGPLNRLQSQWFVQEFFHSQSCWMFDNDLQQMVPVVIESESGSVYDFSSPGVIDLDFDVVRSYNGYLTGGNFSSDNG